MMVDNMWSYYPHSISKTEEILIIWATWSHRTTDLVCNVRHWSWANKERVCRCANVNVKFKWRHTTVCRMELDMNCLVTSNFTDVKMLSNICFLWDWNFIGNTPDLFLYHSTRQKCINVTADHKLDKKINICTITITINKMHFHSVLKKHTPF